MNKKIIIIALALALPLTAAATSGDKGDFEGHHANRVERMAKNLDLNAEQKSKVDVIFKEQHEKLKATHEETRARLQGVLTKEQMTKMDEMKKQRHEKWRKKCGALNERTSGKG